MNSSRIMSFSLIAVLIFLTSCEAREKFDFDLSTPQRAVQSHFSALKYKLPEEAIDSLSKNSRGLYGKSRDEQIAFLANALNKSNLSDRATIEIRNIQILDEGGAKVFYDQLTAGKVYISNLSINVIYEDGSWRVVLDQS